jgi:hypothetical protein
MTRHLGTAVLFIAALGIIALTGLGALAYGDVTFSSPLAPASHNLTVSLPTPPPVPANGIVLGFAGGSGEGFTGSVDYNLAPPKWAPFSLDILALNNLKCPAVGGFCPLSKVLSVIGLSPPAGTIWATFVSAVGGGPYVGYDTGDKKLAWGGYYRAEVLSVNW